LTIHHIEEHVVPGKRLGRHVDARLRQLARPYAGPAKAVASVTWPRHVPILDQGNVGSCFPMGTRIRMADGSEKPIEDVRLLDQVVTAEGNTGRVVRTMVKDEDGGLVRLVLWGHSHLRLTREHPVLTKRGYVPAAELRVGDQVALPRYLPREHKTAVVTAEHVTQPSHRVVRGTRWQGLPGKRGLSTGSHVIPEKIELTPAFGRLVGLFLAEGNIDNAKVTWSLHIDEKDTFGAEIAGIIASYGATTSHRDLPEHKGHKVVLHGIGWARLLSSLCGNGSGLKRLHPDLTSGPPEFLEAVLSGWRDGDGYRRKDVAEHTGITISHDLGLAMYDIAQALGFRPAIRHTPPVTNGYARTRQWRWEVATSGLDARNYSTQDDRHVWRKVRELRLEDFVGPVYNLSVEGDESYVAEGIGVHNCTGNAMTGALATGPLFAVLPANHPILDEIEALALYSAAEVIDGDGPYPPSDNGSTGPSVAKAAEDARLISGFTHYTDLDSTLQALMDGPVILGVNWYSSFDEPAADGTVSIGEGAYVRGGHEVVARSVDTDAEMIGLDNSWGTAWGVQGSFKMSYVTLERLLAENGDCTAPGPLKPPAPPEPVPVPVPTPTPGPVPVPPSPEPDHKSLLAELVILIRKDAGSIAAWLKAHNL
jgi:hypothetical protein